jgi:hypothetical protein
MCQSRETCFDYSIFSDDIITQYGCPVDEPSPSNPNPQQDTSNGQAPRYRRKSYCPHPRVCPVGDTLA